MAPGRQDDNDSYASAIGLLSQPNADHAPRDVVTRIRWTEQEGFDTLTFKRPTAK